jgi:hypothetical protein
VRLVRDTAIGTGFGAAAPRYSERIYGRPQMASERRRSLPMTGARDRSTKPERKRAGT